MGFSAEISVNAATRDAINTAASGASNGDSLKLTAGTFTFSSQIETDKNIGLVGDDGGGTILRKNAACRFFSFKNSNGITNDIKHITFNGNDMGSYQDYYSAIQYTKKFSGSIINSSFENNKSALGGAIYSFKGFTDHASIQNSIFAKNTSRGGGAIYFGDPSTVSIQNSIFAKNTIGSSATYGGGAIYSSNSVNFADFGGTYFLGNESIDFGGANFLERSGSFCAASGDVIFQGNIDKLGPNAIYFANVNNNNTATISATSGNT
ncbi:MAG: hypothetical protein LBB38_04460, partial [Puniceicoccales bacterium]|nr:hypothetical protein [Puniceicoccales bacterium]